jgi:hypothetical protein
MLEYFNPRAEIARSDKFISEKFTDTAAGNSGTMSGTELVRDFERQVNYEGLAYYEMPTDPARYGKTSPQELQQLVSNYLVLLAGGLDQYANDSMEPTVIRSSVMLRSASGDDIKKVENIINAFAAANFPDTVRVSLAGALLCRTH